jgi:hypothetical protein
MAWFARIHCGKRLYDLYAAGAPNSLDLYQCMELIFAEDFVRAI